MILILCLLILIIFLEINECEEPGVCPKNAICIDLLGICQYTCKDGFEGLACSGKKLIMVLLINKSFDRHKYCAVSHYM